MVLVSKLEGIKEMGEKETYNVEQNLHGITAETDYHKAKNKQPGFGACVH